MSAEIILQAVWRCEREVWNAGNDIWSKDVRHGSTNGSCPASLEKDHCDVLQ